MDNNTLRRRSRHLLTAPVNHLKKPSKASFDIPITIPVIEENTKQLDQDQSNLSLTLSLQSIPTNKPPKTVTTHISQQMNLTKFSTFAFTHDIPSTLPTITSKPIPKPMSRNSNLNTANAQKKMQTLIKQIAAESSNHFLDFSDLKFKLERIIKASVNDPEFLLEEKIKLENVYRRDLVNLIKEIDAKTTEKENIRKEMHLAQNKITLSKSKIDETMANFRIFQQAAQKQCSVVMYQRYTIEKEKISKIVATLKNKQEQCRKLISAKKEIEFELSIQLKELKSLRTKNTIALAEYYNNLLEQATDLRNGEGLTWIVYKLLELGYHPEKYRFPLFLNKEYITFLLNYSRKKIEYTQLRLIYEAIKKKYSVNPKKNLIDDMTIKVDPALLKNRSENYIKFLNNYYNDKNSSAYTEMDASGLQPITFLRLLNDLDFKEREMEIDKEKRRKHEEEIKLAVDKETLDDIAEIKNCLEKTKREVSALIENATKAYQIENDNEKVMNLAHYQKIYAILFGKYINNLTTQVIK